MKRAVICFTRVPKPGVTKTRLLPVLKPQQCADLHWAFLKDLADTYQELDAHLFVAYTPDPDWEQLKSVFPDAGFLVQKGSDLGEKMYRAIRTVLKLGYESVILTGADLPMMGHAHLESGFAALETADVTIGPNPDGGYYLIGMKAPHPEIFHVPNYGGATVYENTVAAIQAAGLSFGAALPCGDVDTPQDLRELLRKAEPASATGRVLKEFEQEGAAL